MQTRENSQAVIARPPAPAVSIVMPVRNEATFIRRTIKSLLSQDFSQRFEILVIDGESTDGTREIVREIGRSHSAVFLLRNSGRLPSAGLNVGIRRARGYYIIRADGHALYARSYIRKCVELLERRDAAAVGGVQRAFGATYLGRAIAAAICHPFGVGDARFRYATEEIYADTVYLGAWRRSTLLSLGDFAEVNEDGEMSYRLRRAGGRILVSPEIKLRYLARPSLLAHARQYVWYGRARMQTLARHPNALQPRQMAPPALLLGLLFSGLLFPWNHSLGLAIPVFYLAADLAVSLHLALGRGLKYFAALAVVFPVMHIAWAVGACLGVARFGFPRISLRALLEQVDGRRQAAPTGTDPT